jgi:polysaccharide pyruvyl transferase CsaB
VYRVGITGSYGGCNLGDEAILSALIAQLRAALPVEITVFTGSESDTLRRHHVEYAVKPQDLRREQLLPLIEGLDLLIVGGGGILFDHWVHDHAREALMAEERGVPVMVCAVGAGPLKEPAARETVRSFVEKADVVTLRDRRSLAVLEGLGVKCRMLVTADMALLLAPEPLPAGAIEREGLAGKERVIGMSVREPGPAAPNLDMETYHSMLANAADYLIERFDAHVAFVPMEPQVLDMQHSHAVIAKMQRPQQAVVIKDEYTSGQLISLVGTFRFAVGMRLHFLTFAALMGVPFVALPYAPKVTGFVEELGLQTPPIQQLTVGRLLAYLDRAWDGQEELREAIRRGLPSLQQCARENIALAVRLLEAHPAHSLKNR